MGNMFFPIGLQPITHRDLTALASTLEKLKGEAGIGLVTAVKLLVFAALAKRAAVVRGKAAGADGDFLTGSDIAADDFAMEAMSRWEREFFIPMTNGDGTDSVYEELKERGRRANAKKSEGV